MKERYDVIVIGGGPGGYTAANEAAAAGLSAAVIERSKVGGTCLHSGCIPTKTLMHSSEVMRSVRAGVPGLSGELTMDFSLLQERRQQVSDELRAGIEGGLKKSKVDVINGFAQITDPHTVKVSYVSAENGDAENAEINAENIIIATGAAAVPLPVEGSDLEGVCLSSDFIINDKLPERLAIVGGGVIGLEFATVFNGLGTQVVIIEGSSRLLPVMDKEISQSARAVLKKRNVDIHLNSIVQRFVKNDDGSIRCEFKEKDKEAFADTDMVLVAVGRRPFTEGLFGEGFSVEMNGRKIAVDENMRTSCDSVFAIGDAAGRIELAHAASAEARNVIAAIQGRPAPCDLSVIPSCVYFDPEIACVGMTADEAKAAGIETVTKKYTMMANGKSVLSQQERGFIRIVAEKESGRIIGAQMFCARATDMIGGLAAAAVCGLTVDQMARVIYPHPTFSEGIMEALQLF